MLNIKTLQRDGTASTPPEQRLPAAERLPAVPAAAGAVSVDIAPVAISAIKASAHTTGDLSPVIFCPVAGRVAAVYKPHGGYEDAVSPVAHAKGDGSSAQCSAVKSQDFTYFFAAPVKSTAALADSEIGSVALEGCLLNIAAGRLASSATVPATQDCRKTERPHQTNDSWRYR